MKVLYVSRLFSGLYRVALEGVWEPRGVPTVYRLIEGLDQSNHQLEIAFTCREGDASPWTRDCYNMSIGGLDCSINVVTKGNNLPWWMGRLRGYIGEVLRFWSVVKLYRKIRPDLVYLDRANVYQAALFARLTSIPIVWRVMGITSGMRSVLSSGTIPARITRWAYQAPFDHVICSLDGSGGRVWMEQALAPDTPRSLMLNGAAVAEKAEDLSPKVSSKLPIQDNTMILFVARLVEQKGCMIFIEAFLDALRVEPRSIHAMVVGDGPYMAPMKRMVDDRGAANAVTFLGEVPHNEVTALQLIADVYVSLNELGNLSNANLEAMKAGTCMIFPASQPEIGVDVDTDNLIPSDAALRIGNCRDQKGLTEALLILHRNPNLREQLAKRIKCVASKIVPTWSERISSEITLLEGLVNRGPNKSGIKLKALS